MTEEKPDLGQVAEALGGEQATATAPSPEDQIAQDRAAFDKLELKYKPGKEPAKKAPAKKAPAKKAAPEKESTSAGTTEEPVEGDASPSAAAEEKQDASSEVVDAPPELQKAREGLILAGHPKDVVDRAPAHIVESWWKTQTKREFDASQAFQRAAELQRRVEDLEKATKTEEPSSAVPTSGLDLNGISERLKSAFGDEEGDTLTESLKELVEPLQRRIAEQEAVIQGAQQRNDQAISEANRQRLSEYVPRLAQSERAWKALQDAVIDAIQEDPTKHTDAEGYFDEIARDIYGAEAFEKKPETAEEQATQAQEVEDRKAQVKVSTPSTATKKPKPRKLTPDEQHLAVFKHLEKNPGDKVGARRAAGLPV